MKKVLALVLADLLSAGFLSVLVKGKKSGIFLPGCFKNGKNSTLQFLVVVQCKSDSNCFIFIHMSVFSFCVSDMILCLMLAKTEGKSKAVLSGGIY